jgi:hypothetical protein
MKSVLNKLVSLLKRWISYIQQNINNPYIEDTSGWDVKGNGKAYTTSSAILNSVAGKKAVIDSRDLFLRLQKQNRDNKNK